MGQGLGVGTAFANRQLSGAAVELFRHGAGLVRRAAEGDQQGGQFIERDGVHAQSRPHTDCGLLASPLRAGSGLGFPPATCIVGAVQDLTPQLRTRLGRVERAVGLFVLLATIVLVAGFASYVYHTVKRKGWFVTKVHYSTSLYSAAGIKVGDPVKLMGFDVGEITRIEGERPDGVFNVYIEFNVRAPYFGYLWTAGSKVRVLPGEFLNNRIIEVTKGTNYIPTHLTWEVREYPPQVAATLPDPGNKLFLDVIEIPVVTRKVLSPPFAAEDIIDFTSLVGRLQNPTNELARHLVGRFDARTQDRLKRYRGQPRELRPLQDALVEEFNRLLEGPSLFEPARFADVPLTEETRRTAAGPVATNELVRLNRRLIEQAFAPEVGRTRRVTAPMMPLDPSLLERMGEAGVRSVRVADRTLNRDQVTYAWSLETSRYEPFTLKTKAYWLPPDESPALSDRLDQLVRQAGEALPSLLAFTNQIAQILDNTVALTTNADALLVQSRPLVTNLARISAGLTNGDGALGRWLLPPEMQAQTMRTLTNANEALTNVSATLGEAGSMLAAANTNLTQLVTQLNPPLQNLATIVSNLNSQVQMNTNFVTTLHDLLAHSDQLIQGLKRHWLFRSAFKEKPTNNAAKPPAKPVKSSK